MGVVNKGYGEIAEKYKRIQEEANLELYKEAEKSLTPFLDKLPKNSRVIDVGCGTGFYTKIISENSNIKYCVGIDISKEMIAFCNSSKINAKFITADFLNYNPIEKFDCVVMRAFIHLFSKTTLEGILLKSKEILNEEGFVVASTSIHKTSSEGRDYKLHHPEFKRYRARYVYEELITAFQKHLEIVDIIITKDVTSKPAKDWMNILARKIDMHGRYLATLH